MQWTRGEYELTDDRSRVDLDAVFKLLATSYWAADRPKEVMARAIANSLCLSLWHDGQQVGFCRAVTDQATFTWICDVILDEKHRGNGIGKWMVSCLVNHEQVQTRNQSLATRDAHGLYEPMGFVRTEYMTRRPLQHSAPTT